MKRFVRWPLRVLAPGATLLLLAGCDAGRRDDVTLRFWAMGREGEVVEELMPAFEHEHPGIRVEVQQIPWSAAHEKLLTAYVGGSTPDLGQLGNTWIAEFSALNAIASLDHRIAASNDVRRDGYFDGIWDTNVVDGSVYGLPWYVDTRVLFYRSDLLARAGVERMPETWHDWLLAMEAVKRQAGPDRYAIFLPVNEFMQPVVFGMQAGSELLADHGTRGAFSEPPFRRAFEFYLEIFERGLAPPVSNNEIANMYQEFARGTFAMVITGPWNLGEFQRRLPDSLQSAWATAPLPGPDGAASGVSFAGGSSLVMFSGSKHPDAAWKLMEYLSRPEVQLRFWELTGDLPARREAWADSALAADARVRAFGEQLARTAAAPRVPEWEQIATRIQEKAEVAIRGAAAIDTVLRQLDREVDRMLEKRRWMLRARADAQDATPERNGATRESAR